MKKSEAGSWKPEVEKCHPEIVEGLEIGSRPPFAKASVGKKSKVKTYLLTGPKV